MIMTRRRNDPPIHSCLPPVLHSLSLWVCVTKTVVMNVLRVSFSLMLQRCHKLCSRFSGGEGLLSPFLSIHLHCRLTEDKCLEKKVLTFSPLVLFCLLFYCCCFFLHPCALFGHVKFCLAVSCSFIHVGHECISDSICCVLQQGL